jgi:hypothetical protein
MAIFQKKRLEDEVAVLPRPAAIPQAVTVSQAPVPAHRTAPPSPAPMMSSPPGTYGIEQLMRLMRELPSGNMELVVRVLKKTLESVSISVPGLIQDAARRESELEEKMSGHRRAIAALEEEIASKKRSIEELEGAYKEVMVVKERLNLALTLDHQQVTVTPAMPRQSVSQTIVGRPEVIGPPTDPAYPAPHKG